MSGLLGGVDALKLFARFEAHGFSWGNFDFLARAGIAADSGLAGSDAEDAETAKLDALAAAHGGLEGFEDGFDGLLGLGAADVSFCDDGVDDIELDHAGLPRFRGRC